MESSVTGSNIRMNANDYILELSRPLVKSAYQKNNFFISKIKHMLIVLKRTALFKRFFLAPKTNVKTDG